MNQYSAHGDVTLGPSTWVELLQRRALEQPNRRAFTFLPDGENEEAHLTFGELEQGARSIAAYLQSLGAAGERVLLLYPSGLDHVLAFMGCLYAGAIAVSVYPPRLNRSLLRLRSIVDDARPKMVLTTSSVLSRVEPLLEETGLSMLQWLTTDNRANFAGEWREPTTSSDTLAFLQYTSGSTSEPKGVMVSHGNLLYNNRMIQGAFEQTEESTIVVWLPLFHDMGLIGNVLQAVFLGAKCVLMPPEAFLVKPLRWLQAVSRYRAHTSGGPNFSYDLCVRKVTPEQRARLALTCWEVAFNGAEPVRYETLERFAQTFASCGFRREAFYPCYGLAEATLFVSGGSRPSPPPTATVHVGALKQDQVMAVAAEDKEARTLVSCGRTWLDQEIVIVDPELTTRCPSDRIGEIWLSGPNVAQGYWNRHEETERTFRAYLADTGEGPFLRSGDLGFFHDGELFITGRLKELIVIAGRNHYPVDIEQTVERSHPALRPGCCAAFSIDADSEERLVIAAEVERCYRPADTAGVLATRGRPPLEVKAVVQAVRQAIAEQHDLGTHAVLLLKPAGCPKTSSGKVQRHACRAAFLAGTLNVLEP